MRHYYAINHHMGIMHYANTGKPVCHLLRFDDRSKRDAYVASYSAPNYCPQAFAEAVSAKAARPLMPNNAWGETNDHWIADDSGDFEAIYH